MLNEFEKLNDRWNGALDAGDLVLSLEIAMEGYDLARKSGTEVDRLMFLGFIRHAAEKLVNSRAMLTPFSL